MTNDRTLLRHTDRDGDAVKVERAYGDAPTDSVYIEVRSRSHVSSGAPAVTGGVYVPKAALLEALGSPAPAVDLAADFPTWPAVRALLVDAGKALAEACPNSAVEPADVIRLLEVTRD